MNDKIFSNINKIIERDSKSTTYKLALLRGVIDIIQDNSPFVGIYGNKVTIPTGLLIEKWMIYYYPILEYHIPIPQSNGEKNLSFGKQFRQIITAYKNRNGFMGFYEDMKKNGIPKEIQGEVLILSRKIFQAITQMPMKHIGYSINHEHYSIFQFNPNHKKGKPYILDVNYLIEYFGTFSFPLEYYNAFKMLGSFISGQDSLLFKWAEFSVNASRDRIKKEEVINQVLKSPITERAIQHSKQIFQKEIKKTGSLLCVWTGDKITRYEIDHVIPFSVWKNNDLWNLLPTKRSINNNKRDKIPSPETIEKHKNEILHYWEILNKVESNKFQREITVALVGNILNTGWQENAINRLQRNCEYLISYRGFEPWNI